MTIFRSNNTVEDKINRMAGCLAGQFCGDAFGAQFEFMGADQILRLAGLGYREMGDSKVWHTPAGQITDDSEMAVALINSIIEGKGYFSDIAKKYYTKWYKSNPFDIGGTTSQALGGYGEKNEASEANGGMMRISPLAVYHAQKLMMADSFSPSELDADTVEDTAITHPNWVCKEAGILFVRALVLAILGYEKDRILNILEAYVKAIDDSKIVNIKEAIISSRNIKPQDIPGKSGWVVLALHNAIYRLLHCESSEQAIRESAYMGGDTDTNCAIAGALVGAYYGFDSFPADWISKVENCDTKLGRHPRPYYQGSIRDIKGLVHKLSVAAK